MNIQMLPHKQLVPSKLQPRTTFSESALRELADSILEKGILQNLIARPKGKKFEIAAGERRWRAVGLLIEDGKVEKNYAIPVKVEELSDLELVELATTENINRDDMHPLDEANAFSKMLELGSDVDSIALKMGMSKRTVEQRLAIANKLSPKVKEAFANDELTLAQVQQLAAASFETQDEILEQILSDEWHDWTPQNIKEFLGASLISVGNAIFDAALYKGEITNNLFDDESESCFVDTEQARRLQLEAIQAKKDEYAKTWQWVEAMYADSFSRWQYDSPQPANPSEQGVVILVYGDSMKVEVIEGLVKRYSVASSQATESIASEKQEKPKLPKDAYTKKLLETSRKLKTIALQTELQKDFRTCLIVNIMGMLGVEDVKLSVDPNHPGKDYHTPALATIFESHAEALVKTSEAHKIEAYPLRTRVYSEQLKIYEYLKVLDTTQLQDLFTALTASTYGTWSGYNPDTGDDALAVSIATDLDINMLEHFTLSEDYLKLYRKDALVKLAHFLGTTMDISGLKTKSLISFVLEKAKGKTFLPGLMDFFEEGTEPTIGTLKRVEKESLEKAA
jgi:ParB family transcriptional regulator, chromosome partitioning protein